MLLGRVHPGFGAFSVSWPNFDAILDKCTKVSVTDTSLQFSKTLTHSSDRGSFQITVKADNNELYQRLLRAIDCELGTYLDKCPKEDVVQEKKVSKKSQPSVRKKAKSSV